VADEVLSLLGGIQSLFLDDVATTKPA